MHPKIKDKTGARSRDDHAARGRQIHSGAYQTSGGLHGVGVSVVNALSEKLEVEVAIDQLLYRQEFSRGVPLGPLQKLGKVQNRRGTKVRFKPDAQIFGADAHWKPSRLFRMSRSKAYLFGGVEIRWRCAAELIEPGSNVPPRRCCAFPRVSRTIWTARSRARRPSPTRPFSGKIRARRRAWLARMGGRLARDGRWLRPFLLQHHSDARRRNA